MFERVQRFKSSKVQKFKGGSGGAVVAVGLIVADAASHLREALPFTRVVC